MAEVLENAHSVEMADKKFATRGTGNAALTLGIIGTALGALGAGMGGVNGILGGGKPVGTNGDVERKQCEDFLELTRQYYEGKAETTNALHAAFFDSYKRDVENRFNLYESQRNADDAIRADMNSKFFQVYQLEQGDKAALADKINEVDKKVDMMAAIRPYQDALINCKIDNNALISAYELQKKTCRMIQGELVLPSSNSITGYPSYSPYYASCNSSVTATT